MNYASGERERGPLEIATADVRAALCAHCGQRVLTFFPGSFGTESRAPASVASLPSMLFPRGCGWLSYPSLQQLYRQLW